LSTTFDLLSYTNTADAIIGAGAQINQDPAYRTDGLGHLNPQTVTVSAKTNVDMVNLSGIFDFDLSVEGGLKARRKSDPPGLSQPLGNQASVGGLGASILVTLVTNTPTALIDSGAAVYTGARGDGLVVHAANSVFDLSLVQVGGKAGSVGFSGA